MKRKPSIPGWTFALLLMTACGSGDTYSDAPAATSDAPPARDEVATQKNAVEASSPWHRVLIDHVEYGRVDYAALQKDRAALDRHLGGLGAADAAAMSEAERLAFWINAYNSVVLHHVLESYPIESVKDVDGFFDRLTYPVAGRDRTLNEIEKESVGIDPRAHFAVVCASVGCPDLRDEPFVAERIDAQLEEQTRMYLYDTDRGLRLEQSPSTLWLSSIFKWYPGDFGGAEKDVTAWIGNHVPTRLKNRIARSNPKVQYIEYDWSLNVPDPDRVPPPEAPQRGRPELAPS